MEIRILGRHRYDACLALMNEIHARLAGTPSEPGVILVVEHPPVVTMGNRFLSQDMHVAPEFLQNQGVDFAKIDRGGSVTVHEPGQAVVYPILRVDHGLGVRRFVWCLEEAMIRVAASYGVDARRDPINAGIWVGENKLGAVGIRISEHVAKHGLAFNVTNDLSTFRWIVPCGLRSRGVTTLAREMATRTPEPKEMSLSPMRIGEEIATKIGELLSTRASASESDRQHL